AGRRQSLLARATLPPAIAAIFLEPETLHLRQGERATLTARGELTDGQVRTIGAGDALAFTSSDPAVVAVEASGALHALSSGEASIRASTPGGADGFATVSVSRFVQPDVTGLALLLESETVSTDTAAIGASATLAGTGSLDRIPVEFRLDGPGGSRILIAETEADGSAAVVFDGLADPGAASITAHAIDPRDGQAFADTRSFAVIHRNRDAEPNDSVAAAIEMRGVVPIAGEVGGADAADFYRVERAVPGTLSLSLGGEGARLALLDAAGALLGTADGDGAPLARAIPASEAPLFVRVTASGPVAYTIDSRFVATPPVIERIEPASAPPGSTVAILGSGFSPRADRHLVFFQGLRTRVLSASPGRLAVVVPAFATDGAVVVWVDSAKSNEAHFTTGAPHWYTQASETETLPAEIVVDDESGNRVVRDRLEVAFQPEVTRDSVEALAARLGAVIVGVWPPRNAYELRFEGADLAALRARRAEVGVLPEVRYVRLLGLPEPDAFPIAGRDDWPGRQIPAKPSSPSDARRSGAYAQIHAFEAWQWIADSGFFRKPIDFDPVVVAVLDHGLLTSAISDPQLPYNKVVMDLDFHEVPFGVVHPHGTHAAALVGAVNVEDGSQRSTGVLGGVIPPGVPSPYFYAVDLYNSSGPSGIDSREWDHALAGCPGAPPLADGKPPPCASPRPMNVVNMSFGQHLVPGDGLVKYWADLIRSRPDALFVASAGNDHVSAHTHVPSAMSFTNLTDGGAQVRDRVISVGAVATGWRHKPAYGRADVRASFSNYGVGVDIAAPGENVLSVSVAPERQDSCRPAPLPANSSFDYFCGTSAAAPLVSGTAGLMSGISLALTPAELKTLLVETATPLRSVPGSTGWGAWAAPRRLDVLRAVQMAMRHRAFPVSGTAPAKYLPGLRRYLWVPDRPGDALVRVLLKSPFERTLDGQQLVIDPPANLAAASCTEPYAVQPSASGDKVYVACRGTNQILVWFANINEEADFEATPQHESRIPLSLGGVSYALPVFPSVQMAMSRDGQVLAIPLRDRRVAFLDTRSDRIVDVKKFRASVSTGELRALAFGANDTLYALTSDGITGQLARKPRASTAARWRIDETAGLKVVGVGEPFASPPSRRPSGLAILPRTAGDHVYVLYDHDESAAAATVHRGSDLALVDPPGSANGRIRGSIPNRVAEPFVAGDMVGFPIGSFAVFSSLLRTGTASVEGMAIDPLRGLAYMAFHGSGNLAHLKADAATGSFQQLASATRVLGDFLEPRLEQRAALETTMRADGSIDAQIESKLGAREERLY
ncbi:MAG: S8 family serine peptidase, partial [Deltaproteobacteria bacterium]|nr:S8 family serine peptidase [Deltaproteobacteria bacterium]